MQIEEHVALAPLTTLRIGGPARFFCRATTEGDLLGAVCFARERGLPVFVMGGGSNLLVADEGFSGLVLQVAIAGAPIVDGLLPVGGLDGESTARRFVTYDVPAGFDWDAFVLLTCQARLTGVECLAGIPGMVGGSPVQNVGAYGQEVSQTISAVRVLNLQTLSFETLQADACGFAYRRSIFNASERGRYAVCRVFFRFEVDAKPQLTYADLKRYFGECTNPSPLEIYEAVRLTREGKGMLIDPGNLTSDMRSAGSFFKNPVVSAARLLSLAEALAMDAGTIPNWPAPSGEVKLPAAWLIERAGFAKGFAQGSAGISSRHTLALTNRSGDASCADLLRLRDTITAEVARRFGIALEQEPVYLSPAYDLSPAHDLLSAHNRS